MTKKTLNRFARQFGYKIVRADWRWGLDVIDDLSRIVDANEIETIYDVGANFGQSAIRFAAAFPSADVHAFEPVASTYARLKANCRFHPRIVPLAIALGNKTGTETISLYGDAGKSSILDNLASVSHQKLEHSETIAMKTLDDYYASSGDVKEIDLLKIDTEGFDIEVLHGAESTLRSKKIHFVYTEFHHYFPPDVDSHTDQLGNLQRLASFLRPLGYRLLTTYTDSVNPKSDLGTYNALFVSNSIPPNWKR